MRTLAIALCLLATPALADVAGVASVIDGDTIEVYGQRIRLHGIDAPESRQLCRLDGKAWQCGKDAANALEDKIARRPVTCENLGRDRYKRIIGRCTVAGEDMGLGWSRMAGRWPIAAIRSTTLTRKPTPKRRGTYRSHGTMSWSPRRHRFVTSLTTPGTVLNSMIAPAKTIIAPMKTKPKYRNRTSPSKIDMTAK